MQIISQPTTPAARSSVKRIAYARNINAETVATTALSFESGHNLSNSMPMFAIFKYASGTFDIVTVTINIGIVPMFTVATLSLVAGSVAVTTIAPALLIYSLSDSLVVDVTSGNLSAATFDVEVWGAKFA